MTEQTFFKADDPDAGLFRQLAQGVSTRLFPGDQAMVSVVEIAPGAAGVMHQHPEEQWGLCLSGSGTRTQGDVSVEVAQGDFWRTPGGVDHTVVAGPEGLRVLDIFAPPRAEYTKPGSGFGTDGG